MIFHFLSTQKRIKNENQKEFPEPEMLEVGK